MVDTPKKRRKDRSPDSGATAPKQTRMHSTSPSTCSRSDTQPRQDRTMPLSKDDKWAFRIKVLSTTTSPNDDLFRDAVKSLVRICFPDGILKQLGQHVVEQHMREERAKPANIQRTMEAFQSGMTRRLIGMLAEYFDTPDQVVSAVQTALGERRKTPNDEETTDSSNTIVEQSLSPKKKRRNRSRELQEATPSRSYDSNLDGVLGDVEPPTTPTENTVSNSNAVSQRQKDRKISSTWDWDIEPEEVTEEASIRHAFPRTTDLFAYHTLPAAQQRLGFRASRKEIRLDMQSLLGSMAQEEFNEWVECLDKLLKGDRGKLVRPDLSLVNDTRLSHMTPAPGRSKLGIRKNDILLCRNTITKFEDAEGSSEMPNIQEAPVTNAATQAIVTRRYLSTEDRDLGSTVPSVATADEMDTSCSRTTTIRIT